MVTETVVTTLAFEANLNGVEVARQGLLNLTRDVNNVAYRFTNFFETLSNKLLGLSGPGMFGSITIASVLFPHQEALHELELATASWERTSRDSLARFRRELALTGQETRQTTAEMQKYWVQAHLVPPRGQDQADYVNQLAGESLKISKGLNLPKEVAAELMASRIAIATRQGEGVNPTKFSDEISYAMTRGGWTSGDLHSLLAGQARREVGETVPFMSLIAAGSMGKQAGYNPLAAANAFQSIQSTLFQGAKRGDQRWPVQGLVGGEMMGLLAAGDLGGALRMMQGVTDRGFALTDIGNKQTISASNAALIQSYIDNLERLPPILEDMNNEAEGVSGMADRVVEQAEGWQQLKWAHEGAFTAMRDSFTMMADAGVLDGMTKLMNVIRWMILEFNKMPQVFRDALAWAVKFQIWFGVFFNSMTVVIGVVITFIMYLWGMQFIIGLVLKGILLGSGALVVFGGWVIAASGAVAWLNVQLGILQVQLARVGITGTAVNWVFRQMSALLLFLERALLVTGNALRVLGAAMAWTARVGQVLNFVFGLLSRAIMLLLRPLFLYIRFLVWQFLVINRAITATMNYVAAQFAAETALGGLVRRIYASIAAWWALRLATIQASIAHVRLGFTAIFAAAGLRTATAAAVPLSAILWAVGLTLVALGAGIFLVVRYFDQIVAALRAVLDWFRGLHDGIKVFILSQLFMLGVLIAVRFQLLGLAAQLGLAAVSALMAAPKFIAMGIASFFSAGGFAAISIAGAPLWAIIIGIMIAVGALAVGLYYLITEWDAVTDGFRAMGPVADGILAQFQALLAVVGPLAEAVIALRDAWNSLPGYLRSPTGWLGEKLGFGGGEDEEDTGGGGRDDRGRGGGKSIWRKIGEAAGFVMPQMGDMEMPGMGGQQGWGRDAIGRARAPGMNLPAGGGQAYGGRSVSITNRVQVSVTAAPGTDTQNLARLVGETVDEALERANREAQTNLESKVR